MALVLITCAPMADRVGGASSAYGRQIVSRVDGDDVAAAAEAMEHLREDAAERELQARQRHERALQEEKWKSDERALREVDTRAEADMKAR